MAPTGRPTEKDDEMRFMVIQNFGETESQCPPMFEWAVADIEAHIAFQLSLNEELTRLGELIDAQGLAGPEEAKFVVSDGTAPVVTDGPFPETKELIAGYRVVEVAVNWGDQQGSKVGVLKNGPGMLVQVLVAAARVRIGR